MQKILKQWTDALLDLLGVESAHHEGWSRFAAFVLVLLIAFAFDFVVRLLFVNAARRIVRKTRVAWDDELFNGRVIAAACHVLTAVLLTVVLPVVFEDRDEVRVIVLKAYFEGADDDREFDDMSMGVGDTGVDIDEQTATNLGYFRLYMFLYLKNMKAVNHDMSIIVRIGTPSAQGLPFELYFFTRSVMWTEYEAVQTTVFSHLIAAVGDFDLRIFQSPTGDDLRQYVKTSCDNVPHDVGGVG